MIISTCAIILGNILVVIFSDHDETILDGQDIINIYATNVKYWVYLSIVIVLFAWMHMTFRTYYHARVNEKRSLWRHSFVEPFAFTVSSTVMGTQAVLNSKIMSMLIQVTARGIRDEFANWQIYVGLVLWLSFVSYWLKRLDVGLQNYPPQFIIPGKIYFI